jgi:lipoate-protein ligase A
MRRTRIAALAAAGVLVAAGTGVAVATTRSDDAKKREQSVLNDAAKRLDVTPSELRDALSKAEDAQLDADVKAGRLTQEQADAIKAHRRQEGTVLGGPGGPHGGPGLFGDHHRFRGGPFEITEGIADALGISREELWNRLRDGKTLEQIAKAEDKSLADVEQAIKTELKQHLDEEVKEGDLTQKQADELLQHLTERLDDLGDLPFPPKPPRGFGHP